MSGVPSPLLDQVAAGSGDNFGGCLFNFVRVLELSSILIDFDLASTPCFFGFVCLELSEFGSDVALSFPGPGLCSGSDRLSVIV